MNNEIHPDCWEGCYSNGWGHDDLIPEAFAHPAKMAKVLGIRIVEHVLERGWIAPGQLCVDPFGGVATIALTLMMNGIKYVGVELEENFQILGTRNINLWTEKYFCLCHENPAYVRYLRKSVYARTGHSECDSQIQDGAILWDRMQKHLPLQGEEAVAGENCRDVEHNPLEQGGAVVARDETKTVRIGEQWQSLDGKEWALEGGPLHQAGRLRGDQGQWKGKTGTRSFDGAAPGPEDGAERSRSPQERDQDGQPDGQFAVDDDKRAHAPSSSKRSYSPRRCPDCNKFITPIARLLQGDSRKLCEVMREAGILRGADCCVSSPPYAGSMESGPGGIDWHKAGRDDRLKASSDRHSVMSNNAPTAYGDTTGQLGAMKEGAAPAIIVSSPPYAETSVAKNSSGVDRTKQYESYRSSGGGQSFEAFCVTQDKHSGDYGSSDGQLSRMPAGQVPSLVVSSPPYAGIATGAGGLNTKPGADGQQSGRSASAPSQDTDQRYGSSDGQLAVMREGDVAAVVGSPPFVNSDLKAGGGSAAAGKPSRADGTAGGRAKGDYYHGESAQNLGNMAAGEIAAVVGSPPFENSLDRGVVDKKDRVSLAREMGISNAEHISPIDMERIGKRNQEYGSTDGQIGVQSGETFWAAAADIVAQCYEILKPGGVAIWVTKDFVRKGKRVPFGDQWQALCESRGFVLACRHRAMLVEHYGEQDDLFGEAKQLQTSRKSFFRRLAENKGSPAIDWEDVICVRKPA